MGRIRHARRGRAGDHGGVLWYGEQRFQWAAMQAQPLERAALVLGLVAAGGIVYFLTLGILGLRPRALLRQPSIEAIRNEP